MSRYPNRERQSVDSYAVLFYAHSSLQRHIHLDHGKLRLVHNPEVNLPVKCVDEHGQILNEKLASSRDQIPALLLLLYA